MFDEDIPHPHMIVYLLWYMFGISGIEHAFSINDTMIVTKTNG